MSKITQQDDIYIRKILANKISSSYRVRAVIDPVMATDSKFDMVGYAKKSMVNSLANSIIESNNYIVREMKNSPEYIGVTYEAELWNFTKEDLIEIIREAFNDGIKVGKMEKEL